MFKKYVFPSNYRRFTKDDDIISKNQLKSSATRGIRKKIQEEYGLSDEALEALLPKKDELFSIKWY
jgi:hypothetical protein